MATQVERTTAPAGLCRQNVEQALRGSPWPVVRSLHVGVDAGTVTLTGWVTSYYEKQIARRTVLGVPGVRHVRDQVEVYYD